MALVIFIRMLVVTLGRKVECVWVAMIVVNLCIVVIRWGRLVVAVGIVLVIILTRVLVLVLVVVLISVFVDSSCCVL